MRRARGAHRPLLSVGLLALLGACSASPASTLGVVDGRLSPCPASPNCVSSQATDPAQRVAPLPLSASPAETQARLLALLASEPRVKVVTVQENYLHAEFSSRVLRFVDDLELLIDNQGVQVRSASRLGYSDLGVNRRRVEDLRQRLSQAHP